jgi:hypothetical protein
MTEYNNIMPNTTQDNDGLQAKLAEQLTNQYFNRGLFSCSRQKLTHVLQESPPKEAVDVLHAHRILDAKARNI